MRFIKRSEISISSWLFSTRVIWLLYKKKKKKKDLFRTFGFCISRIIDIPRIRYLHSMWKKTIVPIFRTIDSCSKYREIPEAFNPFCASCSSILLNIKRITLVFFAKEKDKEWQWNVLSSYFFRPNLMCRESFDTIYGWGCVFEKRRRTIEAQTMGTLPREWRILLRCRRWVWQAGAYECECTRVHDARLLVYRRVPTPSSSYWEVDENN